MSAWERQVEPAVARLLDEVAALGPAGVAAFDADGTLWPGDLGEALLRELCDRSRLLDPPPEDVYAHYELLLRQSPSHAFAFCVEVMKGLSVADVERWSDELFEARFEATVFPSIRAVLGGLAAAGTEILLVSASPALTIRRAASRLGLDPGRVLAVEGALSGGSAPRLTGEVLRPVTCAGGKVDALRTRLAGKPLALAVGDSLLDRDLLAFADRAVLVAPVAARSPQVLLAEERGWPVHRPAGHAQLAGFTGVSDGHPQTPPLRRPAGGGCKPS